MSNVKSLGKSGLGILWERVKELSPTKLSQLNDDIGILALDSTLSDTQITNIDTTFSTYYTKLGS